MSSTTNLLARCVQNAKLPTAGILLYRVCYWHPHMRVERSGTKWIAKSRADWCDETGLTMHQYKTALKALVDANLVATMQARFGGLAITFLRLTPRGKMVRDGASDAPEQAPAPQEQWSPEPPPGWCSEPPPGWMPGPPPGWSPEPPPYIQGDTKQGDTVTEIQKGTADADAQPDGWVEPSGQVVPGVEMKYDEGCKEANMVKAHELVSGGRLKNKKPLGKKAKPPSPADIWSHTLAEVSESYVAPLTLKDQGMLKRITAVSPDKNPGPVISKIISEWTLFAGYVQSAAGLKTVPSQPNIAFAVKHAALAVAYTLESEAEAVPAPAPAPKAPTAAPTQSVAPPKPKMSKEELHAILHGDEED